MTGGLPLLVSQHLITVGHRPSASFVVFFIYLLFCFNEKMTKVPTPPAVASCFSSQLNPGWTDGSSQGSLFGQKCSNGYFLKMDLQESTHGNPAAKQAYLFVKWSHRLSSPPETHPSGSTLHLIRGSFIIRFVNYSFG